jgi:hypothetical protein
MSKLFFPSDVGIVEAISVLNIGCLKIMGAQR